MAHSDGTKPEALLMNGKFVTAGALTACLLTYNTNRISDSAECQDMMTDAKLSHCAASKLIQQKAKQQGTSASVLIWDLWTFYWCLHVMLLYASTVKLKSFS